MTWKWLQNRKAKKQDEDKKFWEEHESKLEKAKAHIALKNEKFANSSCPLAPNLKCYPDCIHFHPGKVVKNLWDDGPAIFKFDPQCRLW